MQPTRKDTRSASRQRLIAGFLSGLPEELQSLVELAKEVEDDEDWEAVSHTLGRLGETAASLELKHIADAAEKAAANLGKRPNDEAFAPLVRAIRSASPMGALAPIAIIGTRQGQSILQQDDGTCEPLQLFDDITSMTRTVVEWPQAIVLPAEEASHTAELKRTFGCAIYVYGAARNQEARLLAAREGATGYVAEPVVLPELLATVRYRNSLPKRPPEVALLGPAEWSAPLLSGLLNAGLRASAFTEPERVGSVLHSLFPDVVVLGPAPRDTNELVVRMIRSHVGRSHVSVLAIDHEGSTRNLGVDAVLQPDDDLERAIYVQVSRMRDHHRDRDVLTQLPNRAGILAGVQRALAWADRNAEVVSIALVQANGLQAAAHQHGSEAANACRRHLAISLERGLRRLDEVGYLGEDQFCAVLYNTRANDVAARLNQICDTFTSRAHADKRLRGVRLKTTVVDTTMGTRSLLPRAIRQLAGVS